MLARMMAALATDVYAMHALKVIDAIRSELGRYYGTVALINLTLGIATGVTMMLLGVPNPFLWGTVAAVLNFIPYVGSALTLLILTVVALVCFDSVDEPMKRIAILPAPRQLPRRAFANVADYIVVDDFMQPCECRFVGPRRGDE